MELTFEAPAAGQPPCLLLVCRIGFEPALLEELAAGGPGVAGRPVAPGLVAAPMRLAQKAPGHPLGGRAAGFLFERQRIAQARFFEGEGAQANAQTLAQAVQQAFFGPTIAPTPWTVHAYAPDPAHPAAKLAQAVAKRLLAQLQAAGHPAYASYVPSGGGMVEPELNVLQLCAPAQTPPAAVGLWAGFGPASQLSHPYPGGAHQEKRDPNDPSRSGQKLAEALALMGEQPLAGQRATDLGAAPGGWSRLLLSRGCQVTAVDHGPMRIPDLDQLGGRLTHLKEDGLRYDPSARGGRPQWLVSDMLIPPGKCLGLLRRWVEGGWMERFVVNIKLPQQQPYAALAPLLAYLRGRQGLQWSVRQLYHDRREVTLMGRVGGSSPSAPQRPAGPKPASGPKFKPNQPARTGPKPRPGAKKR